MPAATISAMSASWSFDDRKRRARCWFILARGATPSMARNMAWLVGWLVGWFLFLGGPFVYTWKGGGEKRGEGELARKGKGRGKEGP
jgi:hypothetical protein